MGNFFVRKSTLSLFFLCFLLFVLTNVKKDNVNSLVVENTVDNGKHTGISMALQESDDIGNFF